MECVAVVAEYLFMHRCRCELQRGQRKRACKTEGLYHVSLFKRFFLSSCSFPSSCMRNTGRILHLRVLKTNQSLKMCRDEILTWRHPVSAARGFSAEPPSWPSLPQTLASSPPALCTVPPSSSSSVHGVAPAKIQNIKNTVSKTKTGSIYGCKL